MSLLWGQTLNDDITKDFPIDGNSVFVKILLQKLPQGIVQSLSAVIRSSHQNQSTIPAHYCIALYISWQAFYLHRLFSI